MLPLRRNAGTAKSGYVCLQCRLQSTSSRLPPLPDLDRRRGGGKREPRLSRPHARGNGDGRPIHERATSVPKFAGVQKYIAKSRENTHREKEFGAHGVHKYISKSRDDIYRDKGFRAYGAHIDPARKKRLEDQRYFDEITKPQSSRAHKRSLRKQWGTPSAIKRAEVLESSRAEEMADMFGAHATLAETSGNDPPDAQQASSIAYSPSGHHPPAAKEEARTDVTDSRTTVATKEERSCLPTAAEEDNNPPYAPHAFQLAFASNASHFTPNTFGSIRQWRSFHTSTRPWQQAAAAEQYADPPPAPYVDFTSQTPSKKDSPIRKQLRQWQELHGKKEDELRNQELQFESDLLTGDDTVNSFTRLPDIESSLRRQNQDQDQDEREAFEFLQSSQSQAQDSPVAEDRYLKPGALVEVEFIHTERESTIAVHMRRLRYESQFLTLQGHWIIVKDSRIQYSITGWAPQNEVEAVLPYLPDPNTSAEAEQMREEAHLEDSGVPRHVAAPLVRRMVQFRDESREIYRKHAGALDNAHDILAHETDLRYGSLMSAATTLLKTTADNLPPAALFTVRKALSRAGFAFNIDRFSHRYTGYMQIRSKEQVKMVDDVRGWMRDWQDDMAARAIMEAQGRQGNAKLKKHRTPRTAQFVYDFIEKARGIVLNSREQRDPTQCGNIGPSNKRLLITPESGAVRIHIKSEFTEQDTKLARFMEAWSCSGLFVGLPRIESLPPLILQAIGLYGDQALISRVGFLFLQEIGTILPYENKRHFDSHLLLPSSQHSKPLQNLASSLIKMGEKPDFHDSLKDLRHDWKDLPVYCIDAASAQEIDDGISIEPAGNGEYWVHVHIANPTGFFQRDHPLAKMARHMGESIYMPERPYVMLPRWATTKHFSLAPNRPCLTMSARLDREGKTLERKIRPGFLRNVLRLTAEEVADLLGVQTDKASELTLIVGGEPPPPPPRRSYRAQVTDEQLEQLKLLQHFAQKRFEIREKNGGVFFEIGTPDVEVWQNYKLPGLAWEHPYRQGSRIVEGDPVIRVRTPGLLNWFSGDVNPVGTMVREMMLLAGEISAEWCAERQIPGMFRGTIPKPGVPDVEVMRQKIMEPAARKSPDGIAPLHLGILYIGSLGGGRSSTKPMQHRLLGMKHYIKITSPLRRYGDMIMHWQIQGALREEARTGKSLVTQDETVDRSFLPLSKTTLETIMLGLQPREISVTKAKGDAVRFWICMLLFRCFHFGESELPFATNLSPVGNLPTTDRPAHLVNANPKNEGKPLARVLVMTNRQIGSRTLRVQSVDLNIMFAMKMPEEFGLPEARLGDVWEVEIEKVDVYYRYVLVRPVNLAERPEQGPEEQRAVELFGSF